MKFGLIGRNGSGKSLVGEWFASLGFHVTSLSDEIRQEAERQHKPLDRDTLTEISNQLKAAEGMGVLAQRAIQSTQGYDRVVFDSIRHPDEVRILKANGVVFMGIDAAMKIRYQRISNRKRDTDFVDFETFKQQDDAEFFGDRPAQNIQACWAHCDVIVDNNQEDKNVLWAAVEQVVGAWID
ncbi:MAG: hypothetical protein P8L47_01715 [Candidatus Marinamargulisbacteria bacterium]|nr:hypothetical protein [bacterium]MDG2264821.1 hypothetical protein [Candidatus Marinamargulisbacteria bacterium]|tara:strand:- start:1151 stop:1696 length:546 start_codon:yes stop_codon:yes gene_type:complete